MSGEFEFRIKEIKKVLDPKQLAQAAYTTFYVNTPLRTGNARNHTSVKGDTISAAYPYATRLDNGYSRKSPNGMSKPTIAFIQKYLKRYLGV